MHDLIQRPRRLRRSAEVRALVRETRLSLDDLVYPLFVRAGQGEERPIEGFPGQSQYTPDRCAVRAQALQRAGLKAVLLFGVPEHKDAEGSSAWDPDGPVQRAVAEIKSAAPELVVITDVCLCEYTDHGHCGIVEGGRILNDPTLERLNWAALSHARAGADMVAPSDMMDGRIGAMRRALDAEGFTETILLSYAVKYASAFYGPFRAAAGSAPSFGDRRTHQMDPANGREALREAKLDLEEGADLLMVKPALPYLDVLAAVADVSPVPVWAYHVSGEYALLHAGARTGVLDLKAAAMESLTAIKRAGAARIVTYFVPEMIDWLGGGA